METQLKENYIDCWKKPNGDNLVELTPDEVRKGCIDLKNTMPLNLAELLFSVIVGLNITKYKHILNGFRSIILNYQDTDSLYIEKKHWDTKDRGRIVSGNPGKSKND